MISRLIAFCTGIAGKTAEFVATNDNELLSDDEVRLLTRIENSAKAGRPDPVSERELQFLRARRRQHRL